MKCQLNCSFGEVVDKMTILKIKSKKIKDKNALKNVLFELETIKKDVQLVNNVDPLFNELYKINSRLWILEDLIREKSKNELFDKQYIEYAESIHKTNDERYRIKKEINIKYGSEIIEEKEYNQLVTVTNADISNLEKGKMLYTNSEYEKSYEIIKKIMEKFERYEVFNDFYVDLLFSYLNTVSIFNYDFGYDGKIKYVIKNVDNLSISSELKLHVQKIYASYALKSGSYKDAYGCIKFIGCIQGPSISYNNMSFFKEDDIDKTLLLYDGGGIGDKIMYSRFIPILCNKYEKNNVIFLVDDCLEWMFNDCFKDYSNYRTVPYSKKKIVRFDYHCNILSLIKYLNLGINDIPFTPLLKDISYKCNKDKVTNGNKTYIFNWKGNPMNGHEKGNRRMELKNAIPLFSIPGVNWIVITKDITKEEKNILKKYNIDFRGYIVDNGKNCYEDSIGILKVVNGVFSTDTSLAHLSANMGVPTYVMLTIGCDWRWATDLWYPNSVLLKQQKYGCWESVISDIIKIIC